MRFCFAFLILMFLVSCTSPLDYESMEDGGGTGSAGAGSVEIAIENNQIYYTTVDGNKLSVSNIGTEAFGAILLTNTYEEGRGVLTFNADVTRVGDKAFRSYSNLASIILPKSVTSIGKSAFQSCSALTSITIPNSVVLIEEAAFYI